MGHIQTSILLRTQELPGRFKNGCLWPSPAQEGFSADAGLALGQKRMGWGGTLTSDATFFIMFVSITTPSDISPSPEV